MCCKSCIDDQMSFLCTTFVLVLVDIFQCWRWFAVTIFPSTDWKSIWTANIWMINWLCIEIQGFRIILFVNVGILLAPSSTLICPIVGKHVQIANNARPNDPIYLWTKAAIPGTYKSNFMDFLIAPKRVVGKSSLVNSWESSILGEAQAVETGANIL